VPLSRTSIVCIGGGTGLSTVLRGLKEVGVRPTAIVTLTDDGGSSGRLRRELDIPPPGDVRACLVALAEDESFMAEMFSYRFSRGELAGHSLGNLFLAALTEMAGSFDEAVALTSHALAIHGNVLPATQRPAELMAEMEDGRVVEGESALATDRSHVRRLRLEPPDPGAHHAAVWAIQRADLIVLGPGSLFSSTLPPLLVPRIRETVLAAGARRLYVANLLQQPNETIGYDAGTHIDRLVQHVGPGIIDSVLVPDVRRVPTDVLIPVDFDEADLATRGVEVISSRITSGHQHDPGPLAEAIVRQAQRPAPDRG
jgi:uncharacterized cofD-like protein